MTVLETTPPTHQRNRKELITRMATAMAQSRARDAEGEFDSFADLLGFSGENKMWTVLTAAAAAALDVVAATYPEIDVEPVVTPEVVTSTPSMKVGDIVIANWNIADTPGLNGQVVKILVFEGDQACVKNSSGTISVFNVKNLQPIPKDF